MIRSTARSQSGAGVIGLLITLAIIAYAAYVGIQWVPQAVEKSNVNSILDTIQNEHKAATNPTIRDIEQTWSNYLNINEMNDLRDAMTIDRYGGTITVNVKYERELDLLFQQRTIIYDRSIML